MDKHRSFRTVRGCNQFQFAALLGLVEVLLLIARRDAAHRWHDPDLQKVHRIVPRRVQFAVRHAGARAHSLHITRDNHRAGAHRILVRELSLEHVTQNFHVPVRVRAKAFRRRNAVLVDDPKHAKPHVPLIVIVREGEAVAGFQPAVIGAAAILTASYLPHHGVFVKSPRSTSTGGWRWWVACSQP